jgi:hypothetical protein
MRALRELSSSHRHPITETILTAVESDDVNFLTACFSHGFPIDFCLPPFPTRASATVLYILSRGVDPMGGDDDCRSAVFYAAASDRVDILILFSE